MIRLGIVVLAASGLFSGGAAAATPLVTGLAVYDVGLDDAKSAGLADIDGTMTVRLERVCEDYVTEAELDARLVGRGGDIAAAPRRLPARRGRRPARLRRHQQLRRSRGRPGQGIATREADGVSVVLEKPQKGTATLDRASAVPAGPDRGGGRGGEGRRDVPRIPHLRRHRQGRGGVDGLGADHARRRRLRGWRVRRGPGLRGHAALADGACYFPPGTGGEQTPAFSTSMVVYENGFAQAAVYDLGEFALRLTLSEFSPLPPKPCP